MKERVKEIIGYVAQVQSPLLHGSRFRNRLRLPGTFASARFSNLKLGSRSFYQSGTFTGILSRDKEFVRSDSDP
ncbi:unnamed protein product [Heterotrigona itama]|uniref:Uncharacterized protein n=1 Tax=Heterotrigona itama TaxID=395501 RepID=A0A6V7H7A5_9HYME|nr:unnamed protein product [Heterotrigona itama]